MSVGEGLVRSWRSNGGWGIRRDGSNQSADVILKRKTKQERGPGSRASILKAW